MFWMDARTKLTTAVTLVTNIIIRGRPSKRPNHPTRKGGLGGLLPRAGINLSPTTRLGTICRGAIPTVGLARLSPEVRSASRQDPRRATITLTPRPRGSVSPPRSARSISVTVPITIISVVATVIILVVVASVPLPSPAPP